MSDILFWNGHSIPFVDIQFQKSYWMSDIHLFRLLNGPFEHECPACAIWMSKCTQNIWHSYLAQNECQWAELFYDARVLFGRHSTMVLIPEYTLFSSCWLWPNFCPVAALEPSMVPNSLACDHCLWYAVQLRLGEGALYGQSFFPGSRGPFRVRFSTPFTGGHYP